MAENGSHRHLCSTLERYFKIECEYKEESRTNLSEQFCKEFSSIDVTLVFVRLIVCLPFVCVCVCTPHSAK